MLIRQMEGCDGDIEGGDDDDYDDDEDDEGGGRGGASGGGMFGVCDDEEEEDWYQMLEVEEGEEEDDDDDDDEYESGTDDGNSEEKEDGASGSFDSEEEGGTDGRAKEEMEKVKEMDTGLENDAAAAAARTRGRNSRRTMLAGSGDATTVDGDDGLQQQQSVRPIMRRSKSSSCSGTRHRDVSSSDGAITVVNAAGATSGEVVDKEGPEKKISHRISRRRSLSSSSVWRGKPISGARKETGDQEGGKKREGVAKEGETSLQMVIQQQKQTQKQQQQKQQQQRQWHISHRALVPLEELMKR